MLLPLVPPQHSTPRPAPAPPCGAAPVGRAADADPAIGDAAGAGLAQVRAGYMRALEGGVRSVIRGGAASSSGPDAAVLEIAVMRAEARVGNGAIIVVNHARAATCGTTATTRLGRRWADAVFGGGRRHRAD